MWIGITIRLVHVCYFFLKIQYFLTHWDCYIINIFSSIYKLLIIINIVLYVNTNNFILNFLIPLFLLQKKNFRRDVLFWLNVKNVKEMYYNHIKFHISKFITWTWMRHFEIWMFLAWYFQTWIFWIHKRLVQIRLSKNKENFR